MQSALHSRSNEKRAELHRRSLPRTFDVGASVKAAYLAVRRYPRDAARRLTLAKVLLGTKRRDLALRHAQRAAAIAPKGWSRASELGQLLFKLGDFDLAAFCIATGLESIYPDARAMRTLSALLTRTDRREEARSWLVATARDCPFEIQGELDPNKPTLLQIRTPDNSRMHIGRDKITGLNMTVHCEGHFSTRHLLATSEFNIVRANVSESHLPDPTRLPSIAGILNTVSCPDRNAPVLTQIACFLGQMGSVPVINKPQAVLKTTRELNSERIGRIDGVRMARTVRIANSGGPEHVARCVEGAGLGYPMILREVGTQTGHTMAKIDGTAALFEYLRRTSPGTPLYAIEFFDCRDREGVYRKTRAFFVNGRFYPVANLKSDHWQIHSADRYRVMHASEAMQQDEQRYLSDPIAYLGAKRVRRLFAIRDLIGLDFFGIDFSTAPDDKLVVFEANAAMRHNYDYADAFPYTRPYLDRISAAFTQMVQARVANGPLRSADLSRASDLG
ncbi:MAG: tetratricopeptide repeat protein [Pseudomonadota bacterium]